MSLSAEQISAATLPVLSNPSNRDAWLAVIDQLEAQNRLPAPPSAEALNILLAGTPPPAAVALHDAPDQYGLVALTGLRDPVRAAKRYAIDEIRALTDPTAEQGGTLLTNIQEAGARWRTGEAHMVAECYKCFKAERGGRVVWPQIEPPDDIPNSIAMPATTAEYNGSSYNIATVAGTIAYLNAQPDTDPNSGSPGFLPGH